MVTRERLLLGLGVGVGYATMMAVGWRVPGADFTPWPFRVALLLGLVLSLGLLGAAAVLFIRRRRHERAGVNETGGSQALHRKP